MDTLIAFISADAVTAFLLAAVAGVALGAVHWLLGDVYRSDLWRTHPREHWDR